VTPRARTAGWLGLFLCLAGLAGCQESSNAHEPVADLVRNGFVRDEAAARRLDTTTISISGFVDHHNLYGDATAREILGEWWSGDTAEPATWRFNLKAHENDAPGHSFAVHVRNDQDRDKLLEAIVADARAGRPTRVRVTGTARMFRAPTNAATLTGLYLEVPASSGIVLVSPAD
jgi:hypothetical protein